jgi:SAM-dependent methyltransferase
MDARHLAVGSQCVDLVLLAFILFHLDRPIEGLSEALRVLRPGGQVGTLTWAGNFQSQATRLWSECLDEHGAVRPDSNAVDRNEPVNAPEKIEALLSRVGFVSPRAWIEELAGTLNAEHLIRLRTSMGPDRPRLDSLEPVARQACVSAARRRMERLAPEDFIARGNVVYAIARSPLKE